MEALKTKTRTMRVFVRVTTHQGPQKCVSGKNFRVLTHQICQKCIWSKDLPWQMLYLAPRTSLYNLEALKIKTRAIRVFVRVTTYQGPQK